MSNINEKINNESNGNGDLEATDTTTVQQTTQTVRFERISNGKCDLTFTPTSVQNLNQRLATDTPDTTTTTTQPNSVNILNVSFPYIFDPSEHGVDDIYGTYTFDCCGCPYEYTIERPNTTTTSTTEDVTTTTSTEKDVTTTTSSSSTSTSTTTSTTTTKDGCDNCNTVRVRKANLKDTNDVTFNYVDCDNVSQTGTLTRQKTVLDLCVCSGSIPSSNDYSIEFIDTCTTGLPVLTCDMLQYTVNDGESGDQTTFNNGSGLMIPAQISPNQYIMGTGTYIISVVVPSGYSNAGDTLKCVSDEVIVTSSGGDTTTTTSTKFVSSNCWEITIAPSNDGPEGIGNIPTYEIWRRLPGDTNNTYFNTSQSFADEAGRMRMCSTVAPTMIKKNGEPTALDNDNPEFTYQRLTDITGVSDFDCQNGGLS